jgi:hypothetical protein
MGSGMRSNASQAFLALVVSLLFSACGKIAQFKEEYENYRTDVNTSESADQSPVTPLEPGIIPGHEVSPGSEVNGGESQAKSESQDSDAMIESEPAETNDEAKLSGPMGEVASREVCEKLRSEKTPMLQSAVLIGNGRRVEDQLVEVAVGKILLIEVSGNDNEVNMDVGAKSVEDADIEPQVSGACVFVVGNSSDVKVQLISKLRSVHISVIGNGSEVEIVPQESDYVGTVSRYIRGNKSSIKIEQDAAE